MTSQPPDGVPAPRRVLVIDDEPAVQMVVFDALTDEGHEVRTAGSGKAALAVLDEWLPDLILLDLTLPEMSGQAFRERQRALPGPQAAIPVVLVTGAHHQEGLVQELGARGLLRKPFDLDTLVALVNESELRAR